MPFPEIDPIALEFTIFGFTLAIRWYALAYIAGILLGWLYAVRVLKVERLWDSRGPAMTPKLTEDFLTWIVVGIIAGGRLGYVLFYQPAYFAENPGEIIRIWDGGMSFHGGFLGVCAAIILFSRRHGLELMKVSDMVALVVPIGIFFGRIANFVNAELWGRPTTAPWGVEFPGVSAQTCPDFWTETCARHPSQLYEAGLEGILLGLVMAAAVWGWHMLKRPGFVAGMFFAGYGIGRFIVEFFRQGDAQYVSEGNPFGQVLRFGDSPWAGLSMGQILSTPMILIGIALMIWAIRRSRPA
ncbi:prolipoprotein diacylglyceryl transferase [Pontivivens insulae]|uniref:Phosphatidylglycerol--prolipoprotein diacylglyceryl transferase n=1 Tax=Pontivivens insulae TaxID=1639689 RepID=A0A2R8AE08_9RHOB|nr:prolipoprotein diacylglyceryl transferase [Pontivivens insulae]RED14400.1 prolipoprotein diacylglyceryl transferase [Pontivivens insulae]SPF30477.1 Prolipoprotein diacylglyceryl transferase [Pontivivens insulae]